MLHLVGKLLIYYVVSTLIFDETLIYAHQPCNTYSCLNKPKLVPLPDQPVWSTYKAYKFLFALILHIKCACSKNIHSQSASECTTTVYLSVCLTFNDNGTDRRHFMAFYVRKFHHSHQDRYKQNF